MYFSGAHAERDRLDRYGKPQTTPIVTLTERLINPVSYSKKGITPWGVFRVLAGSYL